VSSSITIHLGHEGGLAVRVQGLRRYYAMVLSRDGYLRLIKVRDETRTVLEEKSFPWSLEHPYLMSVTLTGRHIACSVDGQPVFSVSDEIQAYENGRIGLLIDGGALSTSEIRVNGNAS
jgi:hypothetical protein